MSIDFGDWDANDSFDTEPPDPAQVARKLHALRMANMIEHDDWELLSDPERARLIAIVEHLLNWLRRQGAIR